MFNLKTASYEIRKAAELSGVKSGNWEPVAADRCIDALPDDAVVAKVYNRNYRDGVEITAGDVRYVLTYR